MKSRCIEVGAVAKKHPEERKEARRPSYRSGTLYLPCGEQLQCIVGDMSKSGAKVKLVYAERLPDEVTLKIFGSNKMSNARVAWKDKHAAGLKFKD